VFVGCVEVVAGVGGVVGVVGGGVVDVMRVVGGVAGVSLPSRVVAVVCVLAVVAVVAVVGVVPTLGLFDDCVVATVGGVPAVVPVPVLAVVIFVDVGAGVVAVVICVVVGAGVVAVVTRVVVGAGVAAVVTRVVVAVVEIGGVLPQLAQPLSVHMLLAPYLMHRLFTVPPPELGFVPPKPSIQNETSYRFVALWNVIDSLPAVMFRTTLDHSLK
jgi:hypothetical protein